MNQAGRPSIVVAVVALLGLAALAVEPAAAQSTLRVVMHSDLKILDPVWSGGYITRNHGYMIYDTLLAMDADGEIKPQMVDRYEVSGDRLAYTLILRDGLVWHDGKPVTAEDCVASIKRWAAKDSMGQKMMGFVKEIASVNPRTLRIVLKEPTGLVLSALGKPSSNVPFMMPKRVAETDPNTQISDTTGSGPFVFKRDEWKPGDRAVYVKFDRYRPRSEPASGLAGGKVANGARSPTTRRRSTPCWPARSTTWRARRTICTRCCSGTPTSGSCAWRRSAASTHSATTRCTSRSTTPACVRPSCGPSTRRISSRR